MVVVRTLKSTLFSMKVRIQIVKRRTHVAHTANSLFSMFVPSKVNKKTCGA